jgi:hypothetical protein
MAVVKTILKNVAQEAVVKVSGTDGSATIALATDLLLSNQALDGETQTATIAGVTWTGAADGVITITRNSVVVMTLQANAAGFLDFSGQDMPPDTIGAASDIVVAISGAQASCWLRIRKTGGYKTKVEDATYGAYDDPTRVGASTTINGSPDYVAP